MTMLVDDRRGSVDLARDLRARGLPVEVTRLECADVAFIGKGPGDEPWPVGIEVKGAAEILEMVTNKRFTGKQLPCLHDMYKVVVLAILGRYWPGPGGELVVEGRAPAGWKREWKYRDVDHWLMTQAWRAGITVMRAGSTLELSQELHDAYTWWTVEGYEGHTSHIGLWEPLPVTIIKPTFERRIAAVLPGVGVDLSAKVADAMRTGRAMGNAGVSLYAAIEGIGKVKAERIVAAWEGRHRQ